jgi:outer membrane protein assembly factor BamB
MPRTRTTLPLLAALLLGPAWLSAGDWPGWRGPDRTGVSAETGLLKAWPDGGPPLAWKATGLGGGFSTPSVARGRIYLLGSRANREYLIALAESDGKEVWAAELGAVGRDGPPSYPGPRSTPTVDGDRVYALGSDGDLVCVDTAGKPVWRKNLGKDLNGVRGRWAYAESPLIDGDVLVCTPGGPKATLAALNKKTGEVIWKATVPGGDSGGGGGRGPRQPPNAAAYASPIVAEVGGVKQYVQFLGGYLVGVSARDGKLLWRYDKITGITNCATPIFHDGCVFVSAASGRGPSTTTGGALVRLTAEGGGVTAKEVYRNKDLANHHGGVVLVGGHLYGTNATSLVCVDFQTGKTLWQNRSVGKGSVTAADGRLFVRGEEGPVAVVEASPAGYKEAGRLKQPERSGEKAWPHPVIANGRLYLRDQGVLLCYDVKAR